MDEQVGEQLCKLFILIIFWVVPKLLKMSVYFGMKEQSYAVSDVPLHDVIS